MQSLYAKALEEEAEKRSEEFRLTPEWMLAGDAIFTVEIPEQHRGSMPPHYTYRVKMVEANGRYPTAWFVSLLTAPDSYTYMGKLVGDSFKTTGRSNYLPTSPPVILLNKVLKRLAADELHVIESFGFRIHHEGKCGCCGRSLTTPESIQRGIGPICAGTR